MPRGTVPEIRSPASKSKQRKKVFKVLAFWAHPTIRAEFPGHVLLVRKYYAVLMTEAKVERVFSGSGADSSKKRKSLCREPGAGHEMPGEREKLPCGLHGTKGGAQASLSLSWKYRVVGPYTLRIGHWDVGPRQKPL